MSFIYSRALVEASLPDSFSGAGAYVQLNLNHMPKPCLLHDKTTERFPLSRYGMTCEPLTEGHGEALLTWWREDFLARTSAQLEPAQGLMASEADSGAKWRGSFAKYNQEESNWKTVQCSLLGDSEEFSETWPRWGSMRNGVSYLRPIPALPICVNEFGLWQKEMWPTPCASASKGSSPASLTRKDGKNRSKDRIDHAVMASDGGQLNPEWIEWLMGWPIGHTELKPLETDKFQEWLQQHGGF